MGRSAHDGVGEGSWSVFAEKVVAERDAALAEVAQPKAELFAMDEAAKEDIAREDRVAADRDAAIARAERRAAKLQQTRSDMLEAMADRDAALARAEAAERILVDLYESNTIHNVAFAHPSIVVAWSAGQTLAAKKGAG